MNTRRDCLRALGISCIIFSNAAFAQSNSVPGAEANAPQIQNSLAASSAPSSVMGFEHVKAIARGSIRAGIIEELKSINADVINQQIASRFEEIAQGKPFDAVHILHNQQLANATEQHFMDVHVTYDPRPIGGILSVRVCLVPIFNGVGAPSRPIAEKEQAQVVDNFDEETVGPIAAELIQQLARAYCGETSADNNSNDMSQ